jgi:hypothetical protein
VRVRSFLLLLLIAGGVTLALRPLLSTGGEPQTHPASIEIAPLSVHHPHADPPKPRPRPQGRTLQQILENPLGD